MRSLLTAATISLAFTLFLTPLFIVGLNVVGVLSGKRLATAWRYIIFGVFVFAAVATPTSPAARSERRRRSGSTSR